LYYIGYIKELQVFVHVAVKLLHKRIILTDPFEILFRISYKELIKQAVILVSVDIVVQRRLVNQSEYNTTKNTDSSVLMATYTGGTFDQIHYTYINYIVILPFNENRIMDNRKEYIVKVAARLKELDREISKLEKIADKAVEEMKSEYQQQIEDLFLKKSKVQEQVEKLEKASGNAWEDMKSGAELSWEVFHDSVENVKKKKF
jgi:hypothetical protein